MVVFLVAPELRTLGGFEMQLGALAAGLCHAGHFVAVLIRKPVARNHPYALWIRASGAKLVLPNRWLARCLDPPRQARESGRYVLVGLAFPFLAVVAAVDAVARRRPLWRAWRGAVGRWHGLVSRVLFADLLTWQLRRALDRERRRRHPDIIDVQHSLIPFGITYAKSCGIPVVYTEYGAPSWELESVWAGLRPVINQADFIIGRAEASISGLRDVCGLAEDRPWAIVPNAVTAGPPDGAPNSLDLPPDDGGVVITAIGRLAPEKGALDLLAAFRQLRQAGLPARLVLAGDGPLRATLESQAWAWGVQDDVTFTGAFDDLAPIMRATHIVAHPTLNDGRSVAVLEAMAWGRPVVGTAVGGVAEIVRDGYTGYLVPPGDPDALAAALRRLILDPNARRRMGRHARMEFVAGGYTVDAMVEQTLTVYRQVIERHRANSGRAMSRG